MRAPLPGALMSPCRAALDRSPISKMTIGGMGEAQRPAVTVEQACALAGRDGADLGDRDAGRGGSLPERGYVVSRHGGEDLVIVAAGHDGFKGRRIGGKRGTRGLGQRHARDIDLAGDSGGAAEL